MVIAVNNEQKEIDPEFENQYNIIDKKVGIMANKILNHVSKYDARILKKINIRLDKFMAELDEIE